MTPQTGKKRVASMAHPVSVGTLTGHFHKLTLQRGTAMARQSVSRINTSKAIAPFLKHKKGPAIYCMFFSHGLMKVGKTIDVRTRIKQILAHGLLDPLFVEGVAVPVRGALNDAEALALRLFGCATKQRGEEVFETVPRHVAKSILRHAAKQPVVAPLPPVNYEELIGRDTLIAIARHRYGTAEVEAAEFVVWCAKQAAWDMPMMKEKFCRLHWLAADLVDLFLTIYLNIESASLSPGVTPESILFEIARDSHELGMLPISVNSKPATSLR